MPTGCYIRTYNHRLQIGLNSKGHKVSEEARKKISYAMKHRIVSSETKQKMRLANIGRKASEETKNKLSKIAIQKGFGKWIKGRKLSEEHKKKISLIHKGKILSEETKKRMSDSRKGYKVSDESKEKMRKAKIGCKLTPKHKENISQSLRGDKNPFWKGGATSIGGRIRDNDKYKQWRKSIFERDNYTCQKCGIKGGYLEAHHKKQFHKLITEVQQNMPLLSVFEGSMIYTPLWDIKNGITLCCECHNLTKVAK